jgi:hypothetical protein
MVTSVQLSVAEPIQSSPLASGLFIPHLLVLLQPDEPPNARKWAGLDVSGEVRPGSYFWLPWLQSTIEPGPAGLQDLVDGGFADAREVGGFWDGPYKAFASKVWIAPPSRLASTISPRVSFSMLSVGA